MNEEGDWMYELIFYGRGGQGAVTASKILVGAALKDGLYAQAVPSFGQERKGAPVFAYARMDREPIFLHTFVYEPDCVVVFDWSLLDLGVNVHQGVKPGGILVVNSGALPPGLTGYGKVGYVDAWLLTREYIGPVPPNAAMLGALARTTGWFSLEGLATALQAAMPGERGERNVLCARAAYERTVVHEY
ncbi:MAG: 2-oxoacid:acceptor oxidoreductase family protein [Thermoanaerobacteraceae bacterium]|nr:2-oxoacid:acceptor oxidoreductase family protein [Thermoanaerobacteraceae bacterium]